MKITTKQYARALYELTRDKRKAEVKEAVSRFVKLLARSNKLKLADKIIEQFCEIYNREHKIVEGEVVSARELDERLLEEIENSVREKHNAEKVFLGNTVDESLKGGFVLKVGDEVVDGSVKERLNDLKRILIS